jgi:4-hydroxybutyrate dehydrogenase
MHQIAYLTNIRFDFGAVGALQEELDRLTIRRPLIVTDRGIEASGLLGRLLATLKTAGSPAIFRDTPGNPTEEAAEAALALYRSEVCDGVIGFGGGSPIDLGKAVALLATHEGPLVRYAAIEGGAARITAAVAPLIAVPTTAGTGSEVGRAALITLRDSRKLGLISPHLIPKTALCDPELTFGLPPRLTAATGMDAVAHCIETYLSPRLNPPAEAIALDGLARALAHLPRAVLDGGDRAARFEMMMAALEGGLTFQKGLGAVHSLSHALGSLKEPSMHHGTLNAILLPPVLRFNEVAAPAAKWQALRRAAACPPDVALDEHISRFSNSLGLPGRLSEIGYAGQHSSEMVWQALADHSTATNPRAVTEADFRELLQAAT